MSRKPCSVCTSSGAEVVNEMLFAKATIREIAAKTGLHPSSIQRHRHGPQCFIAWRAAKTKIKKGDGNVAVFIEWPDGHFAHLAGPARDTPNEADTILRVVFEDPVAPRDHARLAALMGSNLASDEDQTANLHLETPAEEKI
jgi:hypothetical protein